MSYLQGLKFRFGFYEQKIQCAPCKHRQLLLNQNSNTEDGGELAVLAWLNAFTYIPFI